jgi:hypothetical protein
MVTQKCHIFRCKTVRSKFTQIVFLLKIWQHWSPSLVDVFRHQFFNLFQSLFFSPFQNCRTTVPPNPFYCFRDENENKRFFIYLDAATDSVGGNFERNSQKHFIMYAVFMVFSA